METGDLGPVEVKMRQIIEEQDVAKSEKDEEKARLVRLSNLETSVISGPSVFKAIKKTKVVSSNGKENQVVVSNDEVRCVILSKYLCFNGIFILQYVL